MAAKVGYWGERTATIDWCEDNYEICNYVAEMWNTTSNAFIIALGLFTIYNTYRFGFERRFYMCALMIILVGIGSMGFHSTLLYEMQLLDEVPMVWGTSVFLFCGFEEKKKNNQVPLAILFAFIAALVTAVYIYVNNAVVFQVAFGILVLVLVTRACADTSASKNSELWRMLFIGIGSFLTGFLMWLFDNHFCSYLQAQREHYGWPLSILFQFHAAWHVLTGFGTYIHIVHTTYMRQLREGRKDTAVAYGLGVVPYVYVVAKSAKKAQ